MRRGRQQQPNFDRMLRTFRNRVKRSGKLEKLREKEYYEKPAQRKETKEKTNGKTGRI